MKRKKPKRLSSRRPSKTALKISLKNREPRLLKKLMRAPARLRYSRKRLKT